MTDVEGLGAFTALQCRGVPSRLPCRGVPSPPLCFPDENRRVTKPQNSVRWHDTVPRWRHWTDEDRGTALTHTPSPYAKNATIAAVSSENAQRSTALPSLIWKISAVR